MNYHMASLIYLFFCSVVVFSSDEDSCGKKLFLKMLVWSALSLHVCVANKTVEFQIYLIRTAMASLDWTTGEIGDKGHIQI